MDTYNSIIYGNFLQPVVHSVWALTRRPRPSNASKTNEGDSDWILSGILLTVTMFECALRWTAIHRRNASRLEGLNLYQELRKTDQSLPDVREIFVLRNAIAHGHVWNVPTARHGINRFIPAFVLGRHDKMWKELVDTNTNTAISGLHVVPSLMTRSDFRQVVALVRDAFERLVGADFLLSRAILNAAIWPDGSGNRITLGDLPAKFGGEDEVA